jgi:anti-sigma-K factor RskA
MQDQLVGYLLEALECDELRCVEHLLEKDAEARRQLELLRDALLPLVGDDGFIDPPTGLVARTCAQVRRAHALQAADSRDAVDGRREEG